MRMERMAKVAVKIQAAARGLAARKLARHIRQQREDAIKEMEAAMATQDVAMLKDKIGESATLKINDYIDEYKDKNVQEDKASKLLILRLKLS